MRAIYLTLLLAALSSSAFAEWVAINQSKNYFYDPSTFSAEGKYAKVWGIINYDKSTPNNYPKSKKVLLEIDCHQGQVKTLMFTFNSEIMGKGDVLAESNNSFGSWRWTQPGSLDEALFNISCRSSSAEVSGQTNNAPEDSLDAEEEIVDESKN